MRFLTDENFDRKILDGLRSALPDIDIIRVQDTSMFHSSDPEILEWAAQQGRIMLTHDVNTMVGFAYDRVRDGLPMPGVIEVRSTVGIGAAIQDLILMIATSTPDEFENQVRYIPLH